MFIWREIALQKDSQQEALKNFILKKVKEHEQQNIIRLSMEFKQELGIVTSGGVTSNTVKAQLKEDTWKCGKENPCMAICPPRLKRMKRLITELEQNG